MASARGVIRRLPHLLVLPRITIIIIPSCRAPLTATCQSSRRDRDIIHVRILVIVVIFPLSMQFIRHKSSLSSLECDTNFFPPFFYRLFMTQLT